MNNGTGLTAPELTPGPTEAGLSAQVTPALLLVQAVSGLFSNDDIMNEGPLAHVAGKSRSDWFTNIHSVNFTLIEIAVAAHVVAVLVYAVLKRQDLVRPMVTGTKRLPAGLRAPRMASL